MPTRAPKLLLLALLFSAGCVFGEDVQVTIFTLKDGTKVEALSYASAMQKDVGVYALTTTSGEKKTLLNSEVVRKEIVPKPLSELPDYTRDKLEAQRKAEKEWSARTAAEKSEEERRRTEALIKGEELSAKYDVVRAASADEQVARQRCAVLWDAHQSALATAKAAQDSIARARADYDNAADDLRALDRQRPNTPDELDRWRARRNRADRRMDSAESQIRDSTKDLAAATEQANQHAAELAKAKAVLAQAQAQLAQAQRQYDEAREQAKKKSAPSDPTGEIIHPADQSTSDARPTQPSTGGAAPVATATKSTVARSFQEGEFVQLADGSLWEIHPEERTETARWKQEQEITVVNGIDPAYANRLVNSTTHSAARAKRLK
jgi:hypothetical protein